MSADILAKVRGLSDKIVKLRKLLDKTPSHGGAIQLQKLQRDRRKLQLSLPAFRVVPA